MPALPPLSRPKSLANPHLPVIFHPGLSPITTAATVTRDSDSAAIVVRQVSSPSTTFVAVPGASYGSLNSSPSPGVVVAITLGSVVGFLLLLLIVYSALGFGPPVGTFTRRAKRGEPRSYVSRSVLSFRTRSERTRPPPRKHKARPIPQTEMLEVRTREQRTERTERTERTRGRGGGGGGGGRRSPVIVEPRRREPSPLTETSTSLSSGVPTGVPSDYDSENDVVVIEEHTPPPRRQSRRPSRNGGGRGHDRNRRSSSYRGSSYGDFDERNRR